MYAYCLGSRLQTSKEELPLLSQHSYATAFEHVTSAFSKYKTKQLLWRVTLVWLSAVHRIWQPTQTGPTNIWKKYKMASNRPILNDWN